MIVLTVGNFVLKNKDLLKYQNSIQVESMNLKH